MGYQDIDRYVLKFEDRDGLEVTVDGISTGDLLDVAGWAAQVKDSKDAAGNLDAVGKLMGMLATALVEWNVEDRHGKPVPVTLAGLRSLKLTLVMDIVNAWMAAQTQVDEDLGKGSDSGPGSGLERSIPMEPRSPSRGS